MAMRKERAGPGGGEPGPPGRGRAGPPAARGPSGVESRNRRFRLDRWTREEARGYLDRWRLAAARERTERRREGPSARRLLELSDLVEAARLLGADADRRRGVSRVRRRWAALRRGARG